MNITKKIIITDTNIITDLNNANLLEEFVNLDNVYIADIIKRDEINNKTGKIETINKMKIITATAEQLVEATNLTMDKKKLSVYDALNYILARDNNFILATNDNRLKTYSEEHGIKVIRTLKIIKLMVDNNIISKNNAIQSCNHLKESFNTRIPNEYIDNFIKELDNPVLV